MKLWIVFLLTSCLFFNARGTNADVALTDLPFSSGETLYYKLSYRGLLTSMIWAGIADASMTFLANQQTHLDSKSHQFVLSLSTENYTKAELIQPVRYTYTSTLDKSLQKTLLVEEVDSGENQSHDFLWIDWQNKATQLFKKREKEQVKTGFFELDTKEVWEKDGAIAIPDFLSDFPLLGNNQSYFIHKESGDKINDSRILEPLSLIYFLRILASNLETPTALDSIDRLKPLTGSELEEVNGVIEMAIAISDDIRRYRIENKGLETLQVSGKDYQAIKYKIQTDEKKDNSFYIWLNNGASKIPLRLAMDAPLGKLVIDRVQISYVDGAMEGQVIGWRSGD